MLMKWEKAHNKKISEQKVRILQLVVRDQGFEPGHPD